MADQVYVVSHHEGQSVSARALDDLPLWLNVLLHAAWIAMVLLMLQCADALHVSPAAHHAMDFLIDVLGG